MLYKISPTNNTTIFEPVKFLLKIFSIVDESATLGKFSQTTVLPPSFNIFGHLLLGHLKRIPLITPAPNP